MKRPKPREYGLNSDHAPSPRSSAGVQSLSADPDQPYTQEELHAALDRLLFAEALAERRRRYVDALNQYDWYNGGR